MIIIKFHGRLGNQIFQYVFAMGLKKRFKTFFLIENTMDSVFLKYFITPPILHYGNFNTFLLKIYSKLIKSKIDQIGVEKATELKKHFINNSFYYGYFQSEDYFGNSREYLKSKLIIRKRYRKLFNEKYGHFFDENKVLAIHCRLGDYLNWGCEELGGKNLTLPQSYYINALNKIKQIEKYEIIVVTDDVENIKNKFDFITNKKIVSEEEIIDFQILQNAHVLIVSNSSFSWWAAYLNNKTASIYAPEYWLGFKVENEYPIGIIPDYFIKVPVF